MAPVKRAIQHALKKLNVKSYVKPLSATMRHLFMVGLVTVGLFALYILTNTPSASTANLTEINADNLTDNILSTSPLSKNPTSANKSAGSEIAPKFNLPKSAQPVFQSLTVESPNQSNQTHTNQGSINPSDLVGSIQQTAYLQSQPWLTAKVQRGDSLSRIFKRNGLDSRDAYRLIRLQQVKSILKIRPGQEIKIKKDQQGELALLQYQPTVFDTLNVRVDGDKFIVEVTKREAEIRLNNAKATIHQHLLGAAKQANVSLNTMYNFITLFGWQVDFTMDLRQGDQFSLIYEELYLDNKKVGDGEIIAAELVLSGKVLRAIRHQNEQGFINYYAPDGGGIKGTFLRTPLKFGHVTSSFSKNRLHPIKKIWRAHKGVDYGAPRGTPVLTTGDGTVRLARRNGGYGKTIIIRHGGKYDTVYAHLHGYAKGIRVGVRVKQGEVIGYVGSTGLATGPHLHYEFRINGIHKNPLTVALPRSEPISQKYKSQFQKTAGIWVAELEYLNRIPLAQNTRLSENQ